MNTTERNTTGEPHAAYLWAVAAALAAADLPVADWDTDTDEPAGGAIVLEFQRFEHWLAAGQTVWLCWDEQHGWYSGIGSEDSAGHLRDVRGSGLDLAATPAEVVAWAHSLLKDGPRSHRHEVRQVRDENADDALWTTLATYAA